jgi:diguanylate cyclase (GGDEF)-like protein
MAQQARTKAAVSVLVFDLDHFKSINDRFGHAVGDDTLRLFAATARANVRATDVLARLGGEEFVAILPGGSAEAAMVGERLRAAFQAAAVEISSRKIGATVSIGVATAAAPAQIDPMLVHADMALYSAKKNGRNRVELAESDYIPEPTRVGIRRKCGPPTGHLPASDTISGMWRARSQIEYLSLEMQFASAGLALACAYSGSDEYEASIIAERRKAGAHDHIRRQMIMAALAAVALFLFIAF